MAVLSKAIYRWKQFPSKFLLLSIELEKIIQKISPRETDRTQLKVNLTSIVL